MGSWSPAQQVASKELKILLVGPRRTGKSSTGNTLLSQGQVFDTKGGGTSTAASSIIARRHVTVVDAKGWGTSEEFVPREEKIELLRALDLCGPEGPHVVLIVLPLLDFTEPERKAVERRMEILTSAVWRHTMVLFTCGDRLRRHGCSVQEHIQSGGPPLFWLMHKCRHRYHAFDNKTAAIAHEKILKQEVKGDRKMQKKSWWRRDDKWVSGKKRRGVAEDRKQGQQEQVRELLGKVEDMLQENGAWHFSLHMYQRMEEEWSHREQQLRAQLEAETYVRSVTRKQKTAEARINMEPEKKLSLMERREWGLRKDQQNEEESVRWKPKREDDKEERGKVELKRESCKGDWEDAGCGHMGESRVIMERSTEVKTQIMDQCQPNGGLRFALSPIRRLA